MALRSGDPERVRTIFDLPVDLQPDQVLVVAWQEYLKLETGEVQVSEESALTAITIWEQLGKNGLR